MARKKWFDPHSSFFELKFVQRTILTILFLALASCATIMASSATELTFNPSFEGFNNSLNIFKFPIGVLAILIPAIALLVANHRSEQTKAQMLLTKSQLEAANSHNNFSNYFKHTEEFEKYLNAYHSNDDDTEKNSVTPPKFKYPRRLHKNLFPNAKHGNYSVRNDFPEEIDNLILDLLEISSGFASETTMTAAGRELYNRYLYIVEKYQITFINPLTNVESDIILPEDLRDAVKPIGLLAASFITASSFDESYKPSKLLEATASFEFNTLHTKSSRRPNGYVPFNLKQRLLSILEMQPS